MLNTVNELMEKVQTNPGVIYDTEYFEMDPKHDGNWYLEMGGELLCFVWTEWLHFHADRKNVETAEVIDMAVSNRVPEIVSIPDNWKYYGIDRDGVDEGFAEIVFGIETENILDMSMQEFFDTQMWPVIANLINVTDPGTFNKPYLFA